MAKKSYYTRSGKSVDIDAFRTKYAKEIAAGNMNVNAQGDKIGRGGEVVATVRETTKPYYENNPKAVKRVSIKSTGVDAVEKEAEEEVIEKLTPAKKKTPAKKTRKKAPDEIIIPVKNIQDITDDDSFDD